MPEGFNFNTGRNEDLEAGVRRSKKVRVKRRKTVAPIRGEQHTPQEHVYDVPEVYQPPNPRGYGDANALREASFKREAKQGTRAISRTLKLIDDAEKRRNKIQKAQGHGANKPEHGWGDFLEGLAHDVVPDNTGHLGDFLHDSKVFGKGVGTVGKGIGTGLYGWGQEMHETQRKNKKKYGDVEGNLRSLGIMAEDTSDVVAGKALTNALKGQGGNPWVIGGEAILLPFPGGKGLPSLGTKLARAAFGAKGAVEAARAGEGVKAIHEALDIPLLAKKTHYREIWDPRTEKWVRSAMPSYTTRTGRVAQKAVEQLRKAGAHKFTPLKSGDAKLAAEERRRSISIYTPVRTWRSEAIAAKGARTTAEDPVGHYALRVLAVNRGPEKQAAYYRRQAQLAADAGQTTQAENLTNHALAFDQVAERHMVEEDANGVWHLNPHNVSGYLKDIDRLWGKDARLREQGLVEMGILTPETIIRRLDAPAAEIDHALSGLRESPDRARIFENLKTVDPKTAEAWIKMFDALSLKEAEEVRAAMDDIYHEQLHLKQSGQAYDEQALDNAARNRVFGVPNDIWFTKMRALNDDWTDADMVALQARMQTMSSITDMIAKHKAVDHEGNTIRFRGDGDVDEFAEADWWAENGSWAYRIPFLTEKGNPENVIFGSPGDIHGDIMPPWGKWNDYNQGGALVNPNSTGHEIQNVTFGDDFADQRITPEIKQKLAQQLDDRYQAWRRRRFPVEQYAFKFEGPPLSRVGEKAPKNLAAKLNPKRKNLTPQNEKIRKNGMQITGPISHAASVTRIKKVMPTKKERQYWAKWYEHFEPAFRSAFGDDADAIMRGFALSQANTSPAGGLGAVLKVMDRLRNDEEVTSEGIGMIATAVMHAVQNSPLEKGAAAKLSDFLNALELSKTRGWMGHDVRGGMPSPADIWAARGRGYVDKKFAKKLKEEFDIDAVVDLPVAPSGARYEHISEEYTDLAKHFNKIRFDGRGNWKPAQVQALEWAAVQKMVGVDPEDLAYALERNSYEMAFEATQGVHGLGNDLSVPEAKEVMRRMETRMRQIVEDTEGVYWVPGQEVDFTTGGWSGGQNGAVQFKVAGEARAVGRLTQRLAVAFDQEWVQAARETSSASNKPRSALVIESPQFEDEARKQAFFERLNALSPQSKNPATGEVEDDIQGYMKGAGNSIVIRTHRGTATGKGVDKFMKRYQDVVAQAASDVGIEAKLSSRNVALITGGANGVENPLLTARGVSEPFNSVDDQLANEVRAELEGHIDAVRAEAGRAKPEPDVVDPEFQAGEQAVQAKKAIENRVITENAWPRNAESRKYIEQFLDENPTFAPEWRDVWNRAQQHEYSQYPDWARPEADHDQVGRDVTSLPGGGEVYTDDTGAFGYRSGGDPEGRAAGDTQFSLQYDEAFPEGEHPGELAAAEFNDAANAEEAQALRDDAAALASLEDERGFVHPDHANEWWTRLEDTATDESSIFGNYPPSARPHALPPNPTAERMERWAEGILGHQSVRRIRAGDVDLAERNYLFTSAAYDNNISGAEADALKDWIERAAGKPFRVDEYGEVPAKKARAKKPNYRVEVAKDGDETYTYYGRKLTYRERHDDDRAENTVMFNLFDDDLNELVGTAHVHLNAGYNDHYGVVPRHLETHEMFIKGNARQRGHDRFDNADYEFNHGYDAGEDYRKDIGAFMALTKPILELAEEWKLPMKADFANAALGKLARKWSVRAGRSGEGGWVPEGMFKGKTGEKRGYIHGLHTRHADGSGQATVSISKRTPQKNITIAHEVVGHFQQLVNGLSPEFKKALIEHDYLPEGNIDDLAPHTAENYVEKFAKLTESWIFHGGDDLPIRVRQAYGELSRVVRKELRSKTWARQNKKPWPKPKKLKDGEEELYAYMDDMFAWEDAMKPVGRYAPETRGSSVALKKTFQRFRRAEGQARAYHSGGPLTLLGSDPATKHRFEAKLMGSGYFVGEVTKGIRRSGMKMAKLMSFADTRKAALKVATDTPTQSTDIPIRDNVTHGYRRAGENTKQVQKALDILRSMEIDEAKIDVAELEDLSPSALQEMADFISPRIIDGQEVRQIATEMIRDAKEPIPNIKWISQEQAEEFGLMDSGVSRVAKQAWGLEALGKAADALNAYARLQILYLNPAYYPMNFIGNGVMNLMQQGVFYLPNMKMAAELSRRLGEDSASTIDMAMGTGLSESMGFRVHGPDAAVRNAMNNFATNLVDKIPRRAAWVHEARRMGLDEDWKLQALVEAVEEGDTQAQEVFAFITQKAKDAIVDYDRLNGFEKNVVARLIFFYPWLKGATRWTAQFPLNHPVQATAFAALLAAQQYQANKQIGDRPWYLDLAVPVPFTNHVWNPKQAFTFTTPWDLSKTAIEATPYLKDVVPGSGQPAGEMLAPVPGAALVALAGHRSFDNQDVPMDAGTFINEYLSLPPIVTKLYGLLGPTDSNFHGLRGPASDDSNFLYPRNNWDKVAAILGGSLAPMPLNKDKANWLGQGQRGQSPTNKWKGWEKEFKAEFGEAPNPALRAAVSSKIEWESMKDRGKPDEEDFPDGTKTISESRLAKKIDLAIRYNGALLPRRQEMLNDSKGGYEIRRQIDAFLERELGWTTLANLSEKMNAAQRAANS